MSQGPRVAQGVRDPGRLNESGGPGGSMSQGARDAQ